MPPAWLTALARAALAIALASTAWITCDIYGRGYRQHMRIMEPSGPLPAVLRPGGRRRLPRVGPTEEHALAERARRPAGQARP